MISKKEAHGGVDLAERAQKRAAHIRGWRAETAVA
jgi:hypothetical protein